MYKIKKHTDNPFEVPGAVIPLSNIRQSCMLIPKFSEESQLPQDEKKWNSSNVLDMADTFYLNNWLDLYTYNTVY